ncbi:response regulator [Altericista sp. CCNU0014]|uniref:hybrid sensor histidine kinase/response regulator n=1 Tax=Altericista sp. CCNU0014 TaxID=3082949 RepID=UPI00384E8DA4
MYIEDEELRSLYQVASADHLNAIESGLLHLEKNPQDKSQLATLLRATHSLKGDSRMLGVQDAETLVHQMEELLSAVDKGEQSFDPSICDRLYKGLDAVRRVAREATTGEAANISIFHIVAQLMGAMDEADAPASMERPSASATLEEPLFGIEEALATLPEAPSAFVPQGLSESIPDLPNDFPQANADAQYTIDTIRVKAQMLDGLMAQADELSVAKLQIAQRVEDISELLNLWEDWTRETTRWKQQQGQVDTLTAMQQFQDLSQNRLQQLGTMLAQLRSQTAEDTTRLESVANDLETGLRDLRLMPLSSVFSLFPRMVRDIGKQQDKDINFQIEGGDILADKRILEEIKDPLTHLLRNAIDHGIESTVDRLEKGKSGTSSLRLRGYSSGDRIAIEVLDDGRGLDVEAIQRSALRKGLHTEAELAAMTPGQIQSLIFAPGFSTRTTVTELSGRGVGLDVVKDNVERLKGAIEVESTPNQGCTFRLTVSSNLATTHALIVSVDRTPYAIPLDAVETMRLVSRKELFNLEGRLTLNWQDRPIPVAWLSDVLELSAQVPVNAESAQLSCAILKVGTTYLGLIVDALVDRQTLVLKPQSKLLKRIRNISGATLLGSGEICMVLNPQDLVKSALKGSSNGAIAERQTQVRTKTRVLLVEDSIPIRTQVKRILDGAGYDVTAAVDGLDGFNKLRSGQFDAVVSDVEMPNLTGLELTARIRQYSEYDELPVILVTTLAKEEDKRRGADAGANAYLTKGDFDQSLLLNTLRRFV